MKEEKNKEKIKMLFLTNLYYLKNEGKSSLNFKGQGEGGTNVLGW